jgi:hypothetical protein
MNTTKVRIENKKQDWWDVSFDIHESQGHLRKGKKIYLKQHKVCSALFHASDRQYIYLNAILFAEGAEDGYETFTSNGGVFLDKTLQETIDSAQVIRNFPFFEKSFVVKVKTKKVNKKTVFFVKNKKELEEVWKYYKHPEAKRILIERL